MRPLLPSFFTAVFALVFALVCSLVVARASAAVPAPAPGDIELLDPVPYQKQVVDALRSLEKSPYQILRDRFERGREPVEKDLKATEPGRCFFSDRPLQAVAALLTSETTTDDGPAFHGPQFRKILPLVARKKKSNFFDHPDAATLETVRRLERRYRNDVAFPIRSNASLKSFIPRSMTLQARGYELRRKGKYLLMKVTCEDNGGCFNANQTWAYYYENEDVAYCYFFAP